MSDCRKGVVGKPNILKYRFDFMEDAVKSWKLGYITRKDIAWIPYGFAQFSSSDEEYGYQFIMRDYYGKPINDLSEYLRPCKDKSSEPKTKKTCKDLILQALYSFSVQNLKQRSDIPR